MRSNTQLQELQQWRNRLLQDDTGNETRLWAPAVDVCETPDEIVLEAELPGIKKDEIEIQLNGDTLVLRGERKFEQTRRGEQFHRIERQYGAWQRSFQIEVPVDAQKVTASYEHGVLTVHLPKAEAVKPRQIEISTK